MILGKIWKLGRSGGSVVALAQICEAVLTLVRSVGLARLLPQDQFGIAVGLAAMIAFVESTTDLGLDRSAMRSGAEGELAEDLPTIHSLAVLRGLITGALIALSGPFVATGLHAPEAGWAFAAIGGCSALRGCLNLGAKARMQQYVYWPEAVSLVLAQIAWTAVAFGTLALWPDYRCMFAGILASQFAYVAATHRFARLRWRLGWDRLVIREALRFGLPLIPAGIANAVIGLLDRLVIGSTFGARALALYTTTTMTAAMPRTIIMRYIGNMTLPVFVNAAVAVPEGDRELHDYWVTLLSTVAFLCALGYACLASPFLALVYGARYMPTQLFVGLVSVDFLLKSLMILPINPAMARGRTRFILQTAVLFAAMIVGGIIGIRVIADPTGFMGGLCIAELGAIVIILIRTVRGFPFTPGFALRLPAAAFVLLLGFTVVTALAGETTLIERIALAGLAALLYFGVLAAAGRHRLAALFRLPRLRQGVAGPAAPADGLA